MYTTRTMTRTLQTIPFDRAFRLCEDAAKIAVDTHKQILDDKFEAEVARLEQAYSDSHEAPSEVGFADQVPYPTMDTAAIRIKARQKALVEEFIPQYHLDTIMQQYLMPQIIRWLAKSETLLIWDIFADNSEVLTAEGQIDGKKMLKKIFNFDNEWDRGLYYFLMLDSRSSYLKTQYKGEAKAYCALVPLILYAFKMYRDIPYSKWDRNTLHWVVNDSLCKAMLCEPPEISREQLLEIRELGLVYRQGAKQGETRNPVSCYKLYGIQDTAIGHLPELAQTMMTQIWCAHPTNRTKYMVLDPNNWDSIPAPLVAPQLFATPVITKPTRVFSEIQEETPWS